MSDAEKRHALQIWFMLTLILTDKAAGFLDTVEEGNGLEAWRKLVNEYVPNVRGEYQSMLTQILNTRFTALIQSELESFTGKIKLYQ